MNELLISILIAFAALWMYLTMQALSVSHIFAFFTAPFTTITRPQRSNLSSFARDEIKSPLEFLDKLQRSNCWYRKVWPRSGLYIELWQKFQSKAQPGRPSEDQIRNILQTEIGRIALDKRFEWAVDEIKNPSEFSKKLLESGRWYAKGFIHRKRYRELWNQLADEAKRELKGIVSIRKVRDDLYSEINRIINADLLFQSQLHRRWFSRHTKRLVEEYSQHSDLSTKERANRCLLEEAFPKYLGATKKRRAFFALGSLYFFTAFAVALTNGHIGVFESHTTEHQAPSNIIAATNVIAIVTNQDSRPVTAPSVRTKEIRPIEPLGHDGLRKRAFRGFAAGVLVVALARISAVYLTTTFALHLQLLIVFLGGVLTYQLLFYNQVVAETLDTKDAVWLNQEALKLGGPDFLLFAFASVGLTLLVTESLIWVLKKALSANRIPWELMAERIEEHAAVDQVFSAAEVTKFTDRKLGEIVCRYGLREFLWITNTPPEHLDTIKEALQERSIKAEVKKVLKEKKLLWRKVTDDEYGGLYIAPDSLDKVRKYLKDECHVRYGKIECSVDQLRAVIKAKKLTRDLEWTDGYRLSTDIYTPKRADILNALNDKKMIGNPSIGSAIRQDVLRVLRRHDWVRRFEQLWPADFVGDPWLNEVRRLLRDNETLKLLGERKATACIKKVSRVLVASKRGTPEIDIYKLGDCLRVMEPTRLRYMVINCKYALVHLPLPYNRQIGELSNCVQGIDRAAMVSILRAKFVELWDLVNGPEIPCPRGGRRLADIRVPGTWGYSAPGTPGYLMFVERTPNHHPM